MRVVLRIIENHEIIGILAIFLIVQFAGFLTASLLFYNSDIGLALYRIGSNTTIDLSYAIDFILVLTLILMFINRHRKQENRLLDHRLFLVFEAVVIIATTFFAFLFFLTLVLPKDLQWAYFAVALVAAVVLTFLKGDNSKLRNTVTVVSSIGVGLVLGLYLSFEYAIIALAFLALYDYMAVFVTKAMTKLASRLASDDMAFMVSEQDLEAVPESKVSIDEVAEYLQFLHRTNEDKYPLYQELINDGELPVVSQIELGEGDLGLPLMATVSVFASFHSYFIAFSTIFGSLLGLLAALWFLRRYRTPLPAIPPLFSFIAIASGVALWLSGKVSIYMAMLALGAGVFVIVFGMALTLHRMKEKRKRAGEHSHKQG